MSHSLPCVFRIPLIALFALFVFWLAFSTTAAQAASVGSMDSGPQTQLSATTAYTATLKPASMAMLRHFFGPQMDRLARTTPNGADDNNTAAATILVTKTVGTNLNQCAATDAISVPPQTGVVYCYIVMNTSNITLHYQTVADDKIGPLFDHIEYPLLPYGSAGAGAYFTVPVTVTEDVVNVVIWTAENSEGQPLAQATDQAKVTVPAITLKATINTGTTSCGTETTISVLPNTPIIYCYTVENISSVTLPIQTLVDSALGVLLDRREEPLLPGAKRTIKYTTIATQTITSLITWTSQSAAGVTTTAHSTLAVQIPSISLEATVGHGSNCATTKEITVTINTLVTLCYVVTNTGGFTLNHHEVQDGLYTYPPFEYTLEPGETVGVSITVPVTASLISTTTWRAHGPNGLLAIAQDKVTMIIPANGAVEVRVFYDVDGRGALDVLEPGIPNVLLTFRSPFNRVYNATTDANGIARLTKLPESGNFVVTIDTTTLPPGYVATTPDRDIDVPSGRTAVQQYGFTAPQGTDTDQDSIPDREETAGDPDKDGKPNYIDDDSDGDRILDLEEGVPDYLIPANFPLYLPMIGK